MAGTNILAQVTSTLWIRETNTDGLALSAQCTGVPPTTANVFAKGCLIVQTDASSNAVYENVGTSASPSWNLLGNTTPGEITLAENNLLQGNSSGVAAAVTSITLPKEGARSVSVAASTTAATAGGAMGIVGGAGSTSGAGGAASVTGGVGGATGAGGASSIVGGAGGATSGAGGVANVTGGAGSAGNANGGDVVITGGAANGSGVSGKILHRSLQSVLQGAPAAATVSATLTAANLLAGIITVNQGAGATSAQQLPLAADLDTALPTFAAGDSFDFSVINTSVVDAEDASVTTNTGWTLVGSMDVLAYSAAGTASSARFRARKTGTAAWTLYRIS